MAKNEQNNRPGNDEPASNYAKFTGIAFQMIIIIGICAFAGYKIDEAADHRVKWVTASLSLLGVFAALFLVIRSVKN